MTDTHSYYAYCQQAADQAANRLRMLCENKWPSTADIRLQQRRDAVSRRQVWEDLHRLFLPPMDREDLWLLCVETARLAEHADEIVLEVHRQGNRTLSTTYRLVMQAALQTCLALHAATIALPSFRRGDTALRRLTEVRRCCAQTEKAYSLTVQPLLSAPSPAAITSLRLCDRILNTVQQCSSVCDRLYYILLRNS